MRRVRSDWNDHGWKRNPVRWNLGYYLDGTTLCNCFFLDSKEAVRFKETPHRSYAARERGLPRSVE
jgi:hypothetical protein